MCVEVDTDSPEDIRVTFTADVPLLPSAIGTDLGREVSALLERDPQYVATQLRVWMTEEPA
jgi:hypothetical protein